MKDDKTISRIRKIRKQISRKFGHDAGKLVRHYIKLQNRHKNRLVTFAKEKKDSNS